MNQLTLANVHTFDELVQHCTEFSLQALGETQQRVLEALNTSGATRLVKAVQMLQLQKAISAVGMFSMFDASLQEGLECTDGFRRAGELLESNGESALNLRFTYFQLAINVLKHGRGRSYEALVLKAGELPFRILLPDESFFEEGDVSELATLVEVDDAFVGNCANLIRDVALALRRIEPDVRL